MSLRAHVTHEKINKRLEDYSFFAIRPSIVTQLYFDCRWMEPDEATHLTATLTLHPELMRGVWVPEKPYSKSALVFRKAP